MTRHLAGTLATVVVLLLAACAPAGPGAGTGGRRALAPPDVGRAVGTGEQRYWAVDSLGLAVVARDRRDLGAAFASAEEAVRAFRRYTQALPPRTALLLYASAEDSVAFAGALPARPAGVIHWIRIDGDDRERARRTGMPIPLGTGLARRWIASLDDSAAGPLPEWIVAGLTQLVLDAPPAMLRDRILSRQPSDLIPLDSLQLIVTAADLPTLGDSSSLRALGAQASRADGGGRADAPRAQRLPRAGLVGMQAASVINYLWSREGRSSVSALLEHARRGGTLRDVLRSARVVPGDLSRFETAWRASLR